MNDAITSPNHPGLFSIAAGQQGHFTTSQARECGFAPNLLNHHVRTGKFVRIHRAVYRFRDFPSSPREEVVAAWLAVGKDKAIVSHDTALDLHKLSDVIPDAIHLTVPRTVRHWPVLPGVTVHTSSREFGAGEVVVRHGVRVTSASRSILDAAEKATPPEQIEMAVRQAVRRGLTTHTQLENEARTRSKSIGTLVIGALHRDDP